MNILNHIQRLTPRTLRLWGAVILSVFCLSAGAQRQITIGGDVYGGGRNGAVGRLNTDTAAVIVVYDGVLNKNVYGGGEKGFSNGNTFVIVNDGEIKGNIFGGARMAEIDGDTHVNINGGTINNDVYGGNDVSGLISGSTNLNILSSVEGSVYGGGNGSYAYSDKVQGDYWYNKGLSSIDSLNKIRPNIKTSNILIAGTQNKTTYIGGSVYCGGNSASVLSTGTAPTLTLGSYVTASGIFLGNNGENMVQADTLARYADGDYSTLTLTEQAQFDKYMLAVDMPFQPNLVYATGYQDYTTRIGSFYYGGNVGSMSAAGQFSYDLNHLVIFNKIVGGCNNANVAASVYNAAHTGGLTTFNANKVRLQINGVRLIPATLTLSNHVFTYTPTAITAGMTTGGNIYGGCYQSGIINGNVTVELAGNALSGLSAQQLAVLPDIRDNVFATPLSIFGGGYGSSTTVQGNVSVNISSSGNILKVFGGGEMGLVTGNTTITQNGGTVSKIYGGGFEGPVNGNTQLLLNGGNVYDAIAGACNANIGGYTSVILDGIHVENNVYAANDFGGEIQGSNSYSKSINGQNRSFTANSYLSYLSGSVEGDVYGGACGSYNYSSYAAKTGAQGFHYPTLTSSLVSIESASDNLNDSIKNIFGGGRGWSNRVGIVDITRTNVVLKSSENRDGHLAQNVFGGGYYSQVDSTWVYAERGNFNNIFGASYGSTANGLSVSYASNVTNIYTYENLQNNALNIYGAGSYAGSSKTNITLYGGKAAFVYGGSFNEGYCDTTKVTIPAGSTFSATAIYGGGKGSDSQLPCDVDQSIISFNSDDAHIEDAIYGGNRSERAVKGTKLLINAQVTNESGHPVDIFGGGHGANTVTGYSKVYLNNGARVANAYGGGRDGKVYIQYNKLGQSVTAYYPSISQYAHWTSADLDFEQGEIVLTETDGANKGKWKAAETVQGITYINVGRGATVTSSLYGGGYGQQALVAGSPFINITGGTVEGSIYGGGYAGPIRNMTTSDPNAPQSLAAQSPISAYVRVYGGIVNNVYGGGYMGVLGTDGGSQKGALKTMVEIGASDYTDIYNGNPVVLRSVYGGGEYAAVYGSSRVKMNNGYVGYRYDDVEDQVVEYTSETDVQLRENGNLYGAGFGGGATVDRSEVYMYGGYIRNGLYGGGEIAAVGIGDTRLNSKGLHELNSITRAGDTHIYMYGGSVIGNIFGGGRGFTYTLITVPKEMIIQEYTDGYVFGTTDVNIFRGSVGTRSNYQDGYGNVFGGGNIGYVYSDSHKEADGYYYKNGHMTEDCRVLVSAYSMALDDITLDGVLYRRGEYVPTEKITYILKSDESKWNKLDQTGITIENAIFAGGNVSAGSDKIYANAKTIYGNATASVIDLFRKDLILISNDGVGGLYGDGNLTFVDGYRELNITNYGTDYYTLDQQLTFEAYDNLNRREKAYYEIKYKAKDTYTSPYFNNQQIIAGTQLSAAEYQNMQDLYPDEVSHWIPAGFCTLYAGRMMNTIQRTDFCGVFGSRMVLRGARDRVPDVIDYTDYTINRVRELSLNKMEHDTIQGNYFGIYNVVNLLGAVTSDVDFHTATRVTNADSEDLKADGKTYLEYKTSHLTENIRNNGSSHNKIALASGVYLEIVDSLNEAGLKEYGPVNGVIELDLVNVKTGEGGGYVYARNIHKARSLTGNNQVTLAQSNMGAISYKMFQYSGELGDVETSGNFVHSAKRIVDDCYPNTGDQSESAGQAHYWYVKGDFYVYNQYISAYTSAAQPYKANDFVPMVINPQANSKMQLISVKPNKYAYFVGMTHINSQTYQRFTEDNPLKATDSIYIGSNHTTYKINEPISAWDYEHLLPSEQAYFTDQTYVVIADCEIGGRSFKRGDVLLPAEFESLPERGRDAITEVDTATTHLVRLTNAVSNQRGFLLTLDYSNPDNWNDHYTLETPGSTVKRTITLRDYNKLSAQDKTLYVEGPSMLCNSTGIYGQRTYDYGAIIGKKTYNDQNAIVTEHPELVNPAKQAKFENLWLAREDLNIPFNSTTKHILSGGYINDSVYNTLTPELKNKFSKALICINTLIFPGEQSIVNGELMYSDSIDATGFTLKGVRYPGDYTESFDEAYICQRGGLFGGTYFMEGHNYDALKFCDLDSVERRMYFTYNYDAFDALRANFNPNLALYSNPEGTAAGTTDYSLLTDINFRARQIGNDNLTYTDENGVAHSIARDSLLTREEYEDIPNEIIHWRPIYYKHKATITVNAGQTVVIGDSTYEAGRTITEQEYDYLLSQNLDDKVTVVKQHVPTYIVKNTLLIGEKQYTSGHTIPESEYLLLTNEQKQYYIDVVNFNEECLYYYCVEEFTVGEKGERDSNDPLYYLERGANNTITNEQARSIAVGQTVAVGTILGGGSFTEGNRTYAEGNPLRQVDGLPNKQIGFRLEGESPMQTSTLYVPRQSVILDYQQDRIITVEYRYNYTEVYDNGFNTETQQERHIVNIRLHFEDGVPQIDAIAPPATVLPSSTIELKHPTVHPGAFDILGGGWEIYENEEDARYHRNGQEYDNGKRPLYWYNDGYLVAYYAKTYAGKTYSNTAPLSVANYHRLEAVMNDPHYLYVDTALAIAKREPKIYVDNHELKSAGLTGKSELDLLSDLFALSVDPASDFNKNDVVTGLANLEFIIQSDIQPKEYTDWTGHQLGTSQSNCFKGTIHGQGHTVMGLNKSLIGFACDAKVYNLGVMGSFTSGGISDNGGQIENTWVSTTAQSPVNPLIASQSSGVIVNSFYNNQEFTAAAARAGVTGSDSTEFLEGKVAYALNLYYLEKRYQDQTVTEATPDSYEYHYMVKDLDSLRVDTAYYNNTYAQFRPWTDEHTVHISGKKMGYVEHFYHDGDYRYAKGLIPTVVDERLNRFSQEYTPIWPDDYILFGQRLSYDNRGTHDDHPQAAIKTAKSSYTVGTGSSTVTYENKSGRLEKRSNRVYRAQGYYGNSTASVYNMVYFNDSLALDDVYKDNLIHKNLTALDLTDYKDAPYSDQAGNYMPVRDYDGLTGVKGVQGITRNLLIYVPASDAQTITVLNGYFKEPSYDTYSTTDEFGSIRKISVVDIENVHGHIVGYDGTDFTALNDQYLVDLQDFNAPIAYTIDDDHLMWYQRTPDAFVASAGQGWETISLPFTAGVVTTSQKGVVTHFYQGSIKGHEYWLRTPDEIDAQNNTLKFRAVDKVAGNDILYENTFMWSYYYSNNSKKDAHGDDYQEYYNQSKEYKDYPFYAAAEPYLIGFPGKRYYEFDMSGEFIARNTATSPNSAPYQLSKQTLTFVSKDTQTIGISDLDYTNVRTVGDYTYCPTYQAQTLASATTLLLNAEGSQFSKSGQANTVTVPFRAYLTESNSGSGAPSRGTRANALFIGYSDSQMPMEDIVIERALNIYTDNMNICIESTLEYATTVTITTVSGRQLKQFTIQPDTRISVPVNSRGVYVVNNRKIAVAR